VIEAHGLSRSYGSFHALREATFCARAGRVTGLLGHNGAGKTTCIRLLTGELAPSAGRASIFGSDVLAKPRAARAAAGYLPESAPSYPEMRPLDYLLHRAALEGLPRNKRRAAAQRAIERCWLTDIGAKRIAALSKGYRQRVGLAAAILHDPPAVILDEPASGLDPAQIVETRNLVRELASDKAVLLSSHILSDVEAACDDVVVLARGRVRAAGPLSEIAAGSAKPSVVCEVRADADAAAALADAIQAADSASVAPLESGWTRLTLAAAGDVREPLAAAATANNLLLRELTLAKPSAERVLLDLLAPPPEDRG